MNIDVRKLTKEQTQQHIDLLKNLIRQNKREIKRLISDKKPEEALLLTLKTDDIKQVVKMLKSELQDKLTELKENKSARRLHK